MNAGDAADTLGESKRKFSILMDKAGFAAALSKPPDGILVDVNEAWVNIFGYTRDEVIGRTTLELNINPDTEGRKRILAQIQETGSAHHVEALLRTKAGEWRSFLTNIEMVEIGGEHYIFNTVQDITDRKKTEQQLEQNNQRLNEILASIQDDFYVLDHDWKFAYASRLFTSKIGKEPEDFLGNNIWEMFPKHLGTPLEENFRAAMERREVRRFEIPGKYTEAWYRMTVFPSREGITVIGADITDRKRADELFRYHATLLANVNDAIVASDAGYCITAWNAASESLYGWKAEEVIGRNGLEIMRTEWPEQDADEMRQNIAEKGRWRGEATQQRKDGSRFPVEVSSIVLYDENRQVTGYVSVNRDITERKQAEQALRESEERFSKTFHSSLVGINIFSLTDGRSIDANSAFLDLIGYSREELIGHTIGELNLLVSPEGRDDWIQRLNEQGAVQNLDIQVRHKSGRILSTLFSIVQIEINGEARGLVLAIDITARKQAEDALRENEKQLQVLNESLEQKVQEQTAEVRMLASNLIRAEQRERQRISRILHDDLQQQIYVIQMKLTFLRDDLQKEHETARQVISDIEQRISEILTITRHLSIDISPPILHDEGLSHAIDWLAAQMLHRYGLATELHADEPFAIPDEELQVFLFNCIRELLFNVVKHAHADRAVVTLSWVDSNLRIEVSDNGKGFPIHANGESAGEDGGVWSNYGLPSIRHQLSLFGGRMEIQSEAGKGTRIVLTVPTARADT